ncbi:MAG: hypothetical protein OXC62_16420 [Aestuariivita sp.]|nr:hypothetical protein [Aestuariivita sp.]
MVDRRPEIVYLQNMNIPPDNHELDKRLAVMEECIETMKAEDETAFERLRSDIARRDVETANRDREAARRETVNTRWIMTSILAAAGLIVILLR